MSELENHASEVLEVWKARLHQLTELLSGEDSDSTRDLFSKTKAAYANFRVLDEKARGEGIDLFQNPEVRKKAEFCFELSRVLEKRVFLTIQKEEMKLRKAVRTKKSIAKFQSGEPKIYSLQLKQNV